MCYLDKKIINDYKNNKVIVCNDNEKMLLAEFTTNIFLRNPKTLDILKVNDIPTEILENKKIKSYQKALAVCLNSKNAVLSRLFHMPINVYIYKKIFQKFI